MQLLMRRCGTMIDISPDGVSPLPPDIQRLLLPYLTYQHKRLLRGAEQYDPVTGDRGSITVEPRALYAVEQGRLVTGYGFIPLLGSVLRQAGHQLHYIDISPPRERPDCYDFDWEAVDRQFTFRPRQRECLEAIVNNPGGLIDACPGFGKTTLFKVIATGFSKAKIDVVIRPKDVVRRVVRDMTRLFPLVGQVGAGKRSLGRITIYTADSLHLADGDTDILLADECHQLMADSYAGEIGRAYRQTRNYAFTGTPERMDGAHARLQMFFGPRIFHLPYQQGVELGLVVPIRIRWLDIALPHDPSSGKKDVPQKRWGIWRNDARNAMFASDARTNYSPDEQVLMLVETFDHAVHLWRMLPEFDLCYGEREDEDLENYKRAGLLPANFVHMSGTRREMLRNQFEAGIIKKVIATDVWSTGVDFERLSVLYRLDARESATLDGQAPCRPCRIYEGKQYAEVVDGYDRFSKFFKRKSEVRHRHYSSYGWDQSTWPVGRGQRQLGRGHA